MHKCMTKLSEALSVKAIALDRITEWLRLEGASAGHLVPTPSSSRVDPVDPCLKLSMSIVHLNGWVLQYTVSAFTKAQP